MGKFSLFIILGVLSSLTGLDAQYFGRNKPKYKNFDFKIYQTEHFSIYYYDLDSAKIAQYASWFETWYKLHLAVLQDTFQQKNPVILYNDHGDFQQTFTIGGNIDVSTGGVTEALKNRIVLPLALTNQQSFHVIGHELVHAFQYNMILRSDSTSFESLANYPLWIIEGLAEYLSIGRTDPHTAMWMRDAVASKDFPGLRKMNRPEYFPYRFGQAFWSFFAGRYGDDKIKPFFQHIGKHGLDMACEDILKITLDSLSNLWVSFMRRHYQNQINENQHYKAGKKIVNDENAGRINISPSLSPNGKYLCFLSEKDLFTTDLYLADANSGKIIRKLFSAVKEGHIDNLNAMESAGTWSPDGKLFAFTGFKRGKSVLIIKDVETGKSKAEYSFKEVPFFNYPAWSPDGKSIALSGLVRGQTDLFILNMNNGKIKKITDDIYSEIHSDWSIDGKTLYFATDQLSMERGRRNSRWYFNLAYLEIGSDQKRHIELFEGANHLNPQISHNGEIYFISDRDGNSNIYKYKIAADSVFQLTDSKIGISSLTPYGQAISLSQKKDRLIYTYYSGNSFQIYQTPTDRMQAKPVITREVNTETATLPYNNPSKADRVNNQLGSLDSLLATANFKSAIRPYKASFGLSYLGASGGSGFGGNTLFGGVGLSGGVDVLFSDILGHNQLYTGLALNGSLIDIAGAFTYINQANRLPWGVSFSHFVSRYFDFQQGFQFQEFIDANGNRFTAITDTTDLLRIFDDRLNVFVQYPLSVTHRFESAAGLSFRYFQLNQIIDFFGDFNRLSYLGSNRKKIDLGSKIQLGPYSIEQGLMYNLNAGFVGDNSYFGLTSPLLGYRYRIGATSHFGLFRIFEATLDFRKYFWFKPISVAMRVLHNARYGKDAQRFLPSLIGEFGLMHGFDFFHLERLRQRYGIQFYHISGSKIAVANIEARLPLFGPARLALISADFLPAELNVFLDSGVAWDDYDEFSTTDPNLVAKPYFSTGMGLRINLFGTLVLEPYFAWPLLKNTKAQFGVNFLPGW